MDKKFQTVVIIFTLCVILLVAWSSRRYTKEHLTEESKPGPKLAGPFKTLPSGWWLERDKNSGRWRWCEPSLAGDYCSSLTTETREQAIDDANNMIYYRKFKESAVWEKAK